MGPLAEIFPSTNYTYGEGFIIKSGFPINLNFHFISKPMVKYSAFLILVSY